MQGSAHASGPACARICISARFAAVIVQDLLQADDLTAKVTLGLREHPVRRNSYGILEGRTLVTLAARPRKNGTCLIQITNNTVPSAACCSVAAGSTMSRLVPGSLGRRQQHEHTCGGGLAKVCCAFLARPAATISACLTVARSASAATAAAFAACSAVSCALASSRRAFAASTHACVCSTMLS